MKENLRNIFEQTLKEEINTIDVKDLPNIEKRLDDMRDYAISRQGMSENAVDYIENAFDRPLSFIYLYLNNCLLKIPFHYF